jgi:hypothetical protein
MKFLILFFLYFLPISQSFGEGVDAPTGALFIAHSFASTKVYLGSPSIAVLHNSTYISSYDTFGPSSASDAATVLASYNKGKNWQKLVVLQGQYWSTLFVVGNSLYIIGTNRALGTPVVRRSVDGGVNWTTPRDLMSGKFAFSGRFISGPVPVLINRGRVWRSFEVIDNDDLREMVLSAPVDSDLLDVRNWTATSHLSSNKAWLDGKFLSWEEANLVPTVDGLPVVVLRVNTTVGPEMAAIANISPDHKSLSFDPKFGFVRFPGGGKKFTIRFDPETKKYWSITNAVVNDNRRMNLERVRNSLSLIWSMDLRKWEIQKVLLQNPDLVHHGFQYVDWQFEGDDIVSVIRTAYDDERGGADSQHNSNYIMFMRFKNFRGMPMPESSR